MNHKKQRGFTLAELLIGIAIIAVLVAVCIPIFTKQLRKAKEAVDMANMRGAKAVASVYQMEENNLNVITGSGQIHDLAAFYDVSKSSLIVRGLDNLEWYNITNTINSYGKIIENSIIAVRFNNEENVFEYYWFCKSDWKFYDVQCNLVNEPLQTTLLLEFWS